MITNNKIIYTNLQSSNQTNSAYKKQFKYMELKDYLQLVIKKYHSLNINMAVNVSLKHRQLTAMV